MMDVNESWQTAIARLPRELQILLQRLDPQLCGSVQEIRLRSGRVPTLSLPDGSVLLPGAQPLTHQQLQQCFYSLCGNSVHSYENEILQGFFTLPGGHRVGVAGLAFRNETGRLTGLRTVTSLNLRVARDVHCVLPGKLQQVLYAQQGLLLAGPPGSGKTTLLRSVSHFLSEQNFKTAIVDERSELMPCTQQGFVFPVPLYCDVLSGISKAQGILMTLRSLAPQFIVCDEIGGMEDAAALEQGVSAGVTFVASIHADGPEGLRHRPQFQRLQKTGAFQAVAYLSGAERPGIITKVEQLC